MQIRAIPSAGTILVLGDDMDAPGHGMISGYNRETPARLQPVTPVNAPYTFSMFRGLGQPVRAWVTEYYFATAMAAFVFAETHGDLVPGTCVLEVSNDSGVVFFDAQRHTVKCLEQIGPSAKFQYQFNVGAGRQTKAA